MLERQVGFRGGLQLGRRVKDCGVGGRAGVGSGGWRGSWQAGSEPLALEEAGGMIFQH